MRRTLGRGYELDDDPGRLDRVAVHAFLTTAYWSEGRTTQEQDDLIEASHRVVGLYHEGRQVGFARAVDCAAAGFMYMADVYILPEHRGGGRGTELVREMVDRGPFAGRRWILHTRDAHSLYARLGFGPSERLMQRDPVGDGPAQS